MSNDSNPPDSGGTQPLGESEWDDLSGAWSDMDETIAADPQAPIVAKLVDPSEDTSEIRSGSPFAVDPAPRTQHQPAQIEAVIDGPLQYTATGAVTAAALVLAFASAAAWWFPVGGTMIAGLGCVLAIFGMYSKYRFSAAGILIAHLMLFVLSYSRTLA